MRYKIVLRVFAESDTTGESVELCPGGLVEEHRCVEFLCGNLHAICEQGWGELSQEQLTEFHSRLGHEADAVARILDKREQAKVAGPGGNGTKSRRKAASQSKANVR